MPVVLQYFIAIGSFQGLLLFFLLTFNAKKISANKILGVWCLCLSLGFLGALIPVSGLVNSYTPLIGWSIFLPASYGALLYLYCKHAVTTSSLKITDTIHLLPLLICYALNIDILLSDPETKLRLVTTSPPQSISFLISQWITYLQAFVYLGFSFTLVANFQTKARGNLSNFNFEIFKRLRVLLLTALLVWSLKAIAHVSSDLFFLAIVGDFIIIFLVFGVALAQWKNSKLFEVNGLHPQKLTSHSIEESKSSPSIGSTSGILDENTKKSILELARNHMEVYQAYKNSGLTLNELADAINVSRHHLSETLNFQEGKNFYQFINTYRVKYVCQHLLKAESPKIFDLALEAGFSSKSTFNAVFKQFEGCSPTQYKKAHSMTSTSTEIDV